MKDLLTQATADKVDYDTKISKLSAKIEKESKIKSFIREKQEQVKQLNDLYQEYHQQLTYDIENSKKQTEMHTVNDKLSEILTPESLQQYEELFSEVLRSSKTDSIQEYVQDFINMEMENFKLRGILIE
jgi:hypothetical protein